MKYNPARVRATMTEKSMSMRKVCRDAKLSLTTCWRAIEKGTLPARDPGAAERILRAVGLIPALTVVESHPATQSKKRNAFETPPRGHVGQSRANGPAPVTTPAITDENGHSLGEEQVMLIQKRGLTPEARTYWKIFGAALDTPWQRDQVFLGGDMRVAYEHMLAKARYGGLLAVIGESGSGKTTLKDTLVGDLAAEGEVIVIEPHTQRMEENDTAGKTLKGADIVDAILREVAPGMQKRVTAEAQLNQVASALSESLSASRARRHLLIIDEAHSLPKPTLRHLKRFLEMKNPAVKGLQRPMLSIVLLGQPELSLRLSPHDQSVREVWQRCEVVHLRPLDKALGEYVQFRLGEAARAFEPDAIIRLAESLTDRHGNSYLYPLAVDSWLAEILNATANLSKTINAEQVAEVFADVQRRGKK